MGITNDPQRRLKEHNSGKADATRRNQPYELKYFKEHLDYEEARKHEKWLKKKGQEYKEKLFLAAPPIRDGVK